MRTMCLAAILAIGASGAVCANDIKADVRFRDTVVGFDLKDAPANLTLTIAGPNKFHASASSRSGAPEIDLRQFGEVEDGVYTYHLSGATNEVAKQRARLDNGRDPTAKAHKGATASGTFHVRGGLIVAPVASTGRRDGQ